MGARTYNKVLYAEEWPVHICTPSDDHHNQCQARPNWQPERCKASGKYAVCRDGLIVAVCGTHRRSLIARGWGDYVSPVSPV